MQSLSARVDNGQRQNGQKDWEIPKLKRQTKLEIKPRKGEERETTIERGLSVHLSIITTSGPAAVLSHHLLCSTSRQSEARNSWTGLKFEESLKQHKHEMAYDKEKQTEYAKLKTSQGRIT
ncbi:hypothetical protein OUZ56_007938 [Daphnia magna]|uniref:Uncharacterized protein n=1 Tax=Daphnia magna TaxID=35525 RepID=A0ABR0ABH3_9CRUS|nr:hypothetical protein OUZ56_007938 [Daphnia magna]